jgi:hypothetical protein
VNDGKDHAWLDCSIRRSRLGQKKRRPEAAFGIENGR